VPRNGQDLSMTNENPIWTTSSQYAPPSYDNIYNSSSPINNLPDYESARKKSIIINERPNGALCIRNNSNSKIETPSTLQREQIQTSSNSVQLDDDYSADSLNLNISSENSDKTNGTDHLAAENSEESFVSIKEEEEEDESLKI
jgi:ABC-type Na+ efflux pump permease subunit